MTLAGQRNRPPALAAAVETDSVGVYAWPKGQKAESRERIIGIDVQGLHGREISRVRSSRRSDSTLVVSQHSQAQARVHAHPDVVEVPLAALGAMNDDDSRMGAGTNRLRYGAGELSPDCRDADIGVPIADVVGGPRSSRFGDRESAVSEEQIRKFRQRLMEARANREARRRTRRIDRAVHAGPHVEKPPEPGDDNHVARVGGVAAVVRKQRLR